MPIYWWDNPNEWREANERYIDAIERQQYEEREHENMNY